MEAIGNSFPEITFYNKMEKYILLAVSGPNESFIKTTKKCKLKTLFSLNAVMLLPFVSLYFSITLLHMKGCTT